MRAELAQPGMQVTSRGGYDQLFSMHGSTMIYLFVTPAALALGMYLVPLQIGASGDRLAAAEPDRLLAARPRRPGDVVGLPDAQRRRLGGVDGRVPAVGGGPHSGPRHGPVVRRGRPRRARRHRAGRLPARHHRRAPRARDDAAADAGLHVVDARDLPDDGGELPGARAGHGPAAGRPPRRGRIRLGRRPGRLPEPLLVLRAPGRLRDVLPLPRRGARGGGDLLWPARVRLPRSRHLAARRSPRCR